MLRQQLATAMLVSIGIVAFFALVLTVDWLWSRGGYCTDGIVRKEDNSETSECQTVNHRIENVPGSPILICRCVR
jgi:hypothetical protein